MLTAEDHYFNALDHFAAGDLAAAIAEYKQALAQDPAFSDAMHGLIRALQDAGELDEAIAVANRLAEQDPNDILAHTSLSILYQRKGMVPEAEAEANKARVLGWKQQLKEGKSKTGNTENTTDTKDTTK
jgi:tetratricopeptide (TPR) repeat protein